MLQLLLGTSTFLSSGDPEMTQGEKRIERQDPVSSLAATSLIWLIYCRNALEMVVSRVSSI